MTGINSKIDIVEVGGKDVKETTWYADLAFEVDGVTYTGSETYCMMMRSGLETSWK